MNKYIERTRYPDKAFRTYRFPFPLLRTGILWYKPEKKTGMYCGRFNRLNRISQQRVRKLIRATKQMTEMDIDYITARSRSRDLRFKLDDMGEGFMDTGARWERIERVLTDVFKLSIQDKA